MLSVLVAVDHGREYRDPEDQKKKITLSAFSSSSLSQTQFTFPLDTDIHLDSVPPNLKSEGEGWCALYSPKIERALDVHAVRTLEHDGIVYCVRFSTDGKYLVTCCKDKAQIFGVQTGDKICVLAEKSSGSEAILRSACFSPDGKLLATASEDKLIRIWNISKSRIRDTFNSQAEVACIRFTPDARYLFSGSYDNTLRRWDMHDGISKAFISDIKYPVVSVAVTRDGLFAAAACLDSFIRIWEVDTGRLVEQLKGPEDSQCSAVGFTLDGKGLISGYLDGLMIHWDISALGNCSPIPDLPPSPIQPTFTMKGHRDIIYSIAVSHDGRWIVSGCRDRTTQIWDASNGVVHCMIDGHWDAIFSIDLSSVGNYLVTGGGRE